MNEPEQSAASVAAPPRRFGLFKKILLLFAVLVITLVVVILLQPNEFQVQRSATMTAPPAAVFAQVNDFHNWEKWSPWAKLDPNLQQKFDGAPSGTGAIYSWAGNQEVGEGRMTILESRPNEVIRIKLEFIKPFASTYDAVFDFKSDGTNTTVRWTMSGRNNFLSKAFHLFVDMDKMLGTDFEKGLAAMKGVVEAPK